MSADHDAQALASRVAESMFARDRASQALGMRIVAVAPGRARLAMTVRADMVNGHAICHGGYVFTLADSTFAFACNSHNRNTVARVHRRGDGVRQRLRVDRPGRMRGAHRAAFATSGVAVAARRAISGESR